MAIQPNPTVSDSLTWMKAQELILKLGDVRKALSFLVSLSTEERAQLLKPSPETLKSCNKIAHMVENNSKYFTSDIVDIKEMKSDLALIEALTPLESLLKDLHQDVSDTLLSAKSDAYRAGLGAYAVAKALARVIPNIAGELEEMKASLDKSRRKEIAQPHT